MGSEPHVARLVNKHLKSNEYKNSCLLAWISNTPVKKLISSHKYLTINYRAVAIALIVGTNLSYPQKLAV